MSNPVKVVFVLPSFAGGGAQRVMLTLAAKLDRRRFTPVMLVFETNGPFRSLLSPDIEIISLERSGLRTALLALARALRVTKPDVVVSTMAYVNIGMMLVKPFASRHAHFILREANTSRRLSKSLLGRIGYRLAYRLLYPLANKILCPARYLLDELYSDYNINRKHLTILPNPVDESELRTAADPPRRAPGAGSRFISVGRLTAQKGYDRLLNDFAQLPTDSHLTIFGEGELRDALERQVMKLGLEGRVALAGFEPQPAPWMAGADALLLPSRWEGLPNAALEALACGTPVIATPEAGGIAEICEKAERNAVTLVTAGAPFIAAMQRVSPRPELNLRPSLLPDFYTVSNVSAAFANIIDSLVDRHPG